MHLQMLKLRIGCGGQLGIGVANRHMAFTMYSTQATRHSVNGLGMRMCEERIVHVRLQ